MTLYEVIITRGDRVDALVISGKDELLQAEHFLDEAAQQGQLGGVTSVKVYDEVSVPGRLLSEMLDLLDQPGDWIDPTRLYPVYLSEV